MKTTLLSFIILLPCVCFSEIVFSDDFNGNKLDFSKWWIYKNEPPDPADWEYSVNDGWLNVWEVWGSIPDELGFNTVGIRTWDHLIPDGMTDFDVEVKVKWEEGEKQSLVLGVNRVSPLYLAYVKNEGEPAIIYANFYNWAGWSSENKAMILAPPSGEHLFRLTRQGKLLSAFFNNKLLLQSTEISKGFLKDVHSLMLDFKGPYGYNSAKFSSLHVDYITVNDVVPEPAALVSLGLGLLFLTKKRNRKS